MNEPPIEVHEAWADHDHDKRLDAAAPNLSLDQLAEQALRDLQKDAVVGLLATPIARQVLLTFGEAATQALRDRQVEIELDAARQIADALHGREALREQLQLVEDESRDRAIPIGQLREQLETARGARDFQVARAIAVEEQLGKAWQQLAQVTQELEGERLRLAACTAAALGNTEATRAARLAPEHPYYSASYGDVCRAVDREMAQREELETLRATVEAWRGWVQFVWIDGGPPEGTDAELRQRACERHDLRCTPTKSVP